MFDDDLEDMRRLEWEHARRISALNCVDGYCGADDCRRCHPQSDYCEDVFESDVGQNDGR